VFSRTGSVQKLAPNSWYRLAQNINRAPLRLSAPIEFGAGAVRRSPKIFGALAKARLLPPLLEPERSRSGGL
ncbi:unnamed protein product, partial [Ilex paraguariensis]